MTLAVAVIPAMSASRKFHRHHPRKRMIQYSAAFVLDHRRLGALDRPVKPGDVGCGTGLEP
jgi:hypothetical protein